jgi:limonene-1,2-epoxide hydrolase
MSPEEVVRAEMQAWSTLDANQIMAYFTPDATWLPGLHFATAAGYDEVRGAVEGFLKGMTGCDNEIVNLAVVGNTVLTERVDHIVLANGETLDAPGMGTFEVAGDKITAWRDYFCTATHD